MVARLPLQVDSKLSADQFSGDEEEDEEDDELEDEEDEEADEDDDELEDGAEDSFGADPSALTPGRARPQWRVPRHLVIYITNIHRTSCDRVRSRCTVSISLIPAPVSRLERPRGPRDHARPPRPRPAGNLPSANCIPDIFPSFDLVIFRPVSIRKPRSRFGSSRQIHRRVLYRPSYPSCAQRNRRRRRGQLLHLRPRKIVVARARVPRRPPAATPRKKRRPARPCECPCCSRWERPVAGSPATPPRAAAWSAASVVFASLISLHRVVALAPRPAFQVPQSSLRSGGFGSSAAIRRTRSESPAFPARDEIGSWTRLRPHRSWATPPAPARTARKTPHLLLIDFRGCSSRSSISLLNLCYSSSQFAHHHRKHL